jgi:hypothetical protein
VINHFGEQMPTDAHKTTVEAAPAADPTLVKPQETNPFIAE